jgi:hypothetical protein
MTVPTGDRLGAFLSGLLKVVPVAAFIFGYWGVVAPRMGVTISLLILLIAAVAIQSLVVYLSKRDADDGFKSLRECVDETRAEMNTGFEELEETICNVTVSEAATDGGWSSKRMDEVYLKDLETDLEGTSGAGALSGLVAGGALGIPFGAPGIILGGILGGLLGNAVEYHDLREDQRERLQATVRKYIERNTQPSVRLVNFRSVSEGDDEDGTYWLFEFEDQQERIHSAKIYPDDKQISIVK